MAMLFLNSSYLLLFLGFSVAFAFGDTVLFGSFFPTCLSYLPAHLVSAFSVSLIITYVFVISCLVFLVGIELYSA